jgi:hypothetical protein
LLRDSSWSRTLSEEDINPEHRVDENAGGAQLGSRFPDWRDNKMKNEE